ncbi:uracil-xanthine permease family protein [Megalodesulfovibrio paquesii]
MAELSDPVAYRFRLQDAPLGAQMLFVAFGALVLVPLLTGLDPNVALFTAGAGTLLFQAVTKGKVPVFLASSFAFIPALIFGVKTWGIPPTLCGLAASGVVYVLLSMAIKVRGPEVLERFLPAVVTGPVIMVIGLKLAPVAVNMALGKAGDGSIQLVPETPALFVSMVALVTTMLVSILGRGWFKLLPILCGVAAGYATALLFNMISFDVVRNAAWLAMPAFVAPVWSWEAILYILPIAIAPAIEHVGDVLAIGQVAHKNFVKDPGIHRTLLGDGLATTLAAMLGGPPNTTYSEVSGAVALTKAFNPAIMTWAAITAVVLAFVGKLGALLQTVPVPVMGGILIILFGAITVVGMNALVRAKDDLLNPRNMVIIAVILVFGIGDMGLGIGDFSLKGIGLAGVAGIVLNLILPRRHE